MPPSEDLKELMRLTKENNRLLRKMRRDAIWGGIIKFTLYIVIFVAAPLWLYATYLAPTVDQTLKAYQQISGSGANSQTQFSGFQDLIKQFQEQFSPQQ